ncbi:MAG: purine permease [Spartobacteria bacterium]|nr:purine permease [Spartobacteria bacterium]
MSATSDKVHVQQDITGSSLDQSTELLYRLHDRPPFWEGFFAALQHLLAIFVPIITPALVICGALDITGETRQYIVSMSLFVSGVATYIQIRRIGPIGSGLLSIQGTSFTFVGAIISAGLVLRDSGHTPEQSLPLIFGVCVAGSFIEMVISRFIRQARKIITPLVSGIVVTLIGLTLIKVGIIACAGGFQARQDGSFGSFRYLGMAMLVLVIIVFLNRMKNRYLRMSAIVMGLMVGYLISAFMGAIDFSSLKAVAWLTLPVPFKYGVAFHWSAFIPIALIYVVTSVESIGDITATCMVSNEPIEGELYMKRIAGGVMGDGLNSLIAGVFNTFPNTTFSQNNGIIQLTGVASRHVGYLIAGMLVLLGLIPGVAGLFSLMPEAVLGGATILMFGTVAAAGIKIIAAEPLDRRALIIIAISMSLGLGVVFAPEVLSHMPVWARNIFSSGIVTGGLTAILCNVILPKTNS